MPEITEIANTNFCARINKLVKEKGFNIPKLSKKTGITEGTIHRVLSNPESNPTYSTLKAISEALEVSIGELLGEIEPSPSNMKKVKIVSWEHLEDLPTLSNCYSTEYIATNVKVSEKAFALKMRGSHMLPLFPENTTLVFDPKKECYDRAYVLVKLKEYSIPVFKQLIMDEPHWYIKSLSVELNNESLIRLNPPDQIIAVLAQSLLNY